MKNPTTGLCECVPGWIGVHCNYYAGLCAPGCLTCNGPRVDDCLICDYTHSDDSEDGTALETDTDAWNEQTYVGIECECDGNYMGPDCSIYLGNCSYACDYKYGCTGWGAAHCVSCRDGYEWDRDNE